jgi:hypothetical protein
MPVLTPTQNGSSRLSRETPIEIGAARAADAAQITPVNIQSVAIIEKNFLIILCILLFFHGPR